MASETGMLKNAAFQDGRVASVGKIRLEELLKVDPKDIDYGLLLCNLVSFYIRNLLAPRYSTQKL